MIRAIAAVSVLSLVLTGCVLSSEAVVTAADATFDPRLVGTWVDAEVTDRAVITRGPGNSYTIEYTGNGKTGIFRALLGRLAGRAVLDIWPAPGDSDIAEPYQGTLIPGHVLLFLDIGTDDIRTRALEPDSVLAALRSGRVRLPWSHENDQPILRGTTAQLRAGLGRLLADDRALGEASVWRRAGATAAAPARDPARPPELPCVDAAAWREADRLFHRDPHWVGGDAASSVDLGGGRILWLFGDSWIDPSGRGTRQGARMVSNSVAIQRGTDPTTATMQFSWGRHPDGSPAPFVPDEDGIRHWFGNGVRVGDRLVLFLNRVRNASNAIGFESAGWAAWLVDNPDAEPSTWRLQRLATPSNPLGVILGFAAVLPLNNYLYAFGSQDPVKSHPIFAARWPLDQVRLGNLSSPAWWSGSFAGWVPDSSNAPRQPLFENGQSELSIHADPARRLFLAVQTSGFGAADVMMRTASFINGPWSAPRMIHRPAEYYRPNVMIYSAKAHPELTGADLAVTYSTNTFRFAEHQSDSTIYYPRFVRLTWCP